MNCFKLIAMALPLALSSAAFAADSSAAGSEYYHQAAAGKWEVTPGFTFGSIKQTYTSDRAGGTTSATDSLFNFNVGGEYGINDMIAVGLKLGYQSDSWKDTPDDLKTTASGMMDPVLYERTVMNLGMGSLHFGADLGVSLGKHTVNNDDATTVKENEYSGGFTFTPYVGYDMNVGPGIVGVNLSYDLVRTDRKTQDKSSANPTDMTTKNGNALTFAAFWEMNFHPVIWGVDIGIRNQQATKTTADATGNSMFGDGTDHNGQTNFFVETYAAWEVAPDIAILPKLGYGTLNQDADFASKSTSGIYLQVAARFGF